MPPILHPRSRSTSSLFAATMLASVVIVGLPHVFPCPAPRRTLADSNMVMTADGQQAERPRRRRRKLGPEEDAFPNTNAVQKNTTPQSTDEEVSTFLQMEAEAESMAKVGRECPVPKPRGIIGELLGFSNKNTADQQNSGLSGRSSSS